MLECCAVGLGRIIFDALPGVSLTCLMRFAKRLGVTA